MVNEILSKRTIAVLLVLSMLLSVFGTLAVLNYLEGYEPPVIRTGPAAMPVSKDSSNVGQLSLEIVAPPKPVSATGYVAFDLQKVEE